MLTIDEHSGNIAVDLVQVHTTDQPDTDLNLVGGRKWTKKEADKFAKQVAGKVESTRYDINSVIGQDPAKVKEKRTKDFAKMLTRAKGMKTQIEERWTLYQAARSSGNVEEQKWNFQFIHDLEQEAHKMWKLRHDWVTEGIIDKAGQGLKTGTLAPERAAFLMMIRMNMFNFATAFRIAQKRSPETYAKFRLKFKQLGGNRTKFDAAVAKGYKKKPILAKKMVVSDLSFDGYSANAVSENTYNRVQKLKVGVEIGQQVAEKAASVDYSKGDGKTLKLPAGAGNAAGFAVAGIGVATGTPTGVAIATYAIPAGAVMDGLILVLNSANIPLKAGEKNAEQATSDEIKSDMANIDTSDTKDEWIANVPNWAVAGLGIGVLALGTWYGISYFKSKK